MVVAAVLNLGASFMNSGAGSGSVDFFHGLQVAIMMTLMLNLTQFVWWRCKQSRTGSCWQVHRPTFVTLLSAIMVNFQPLSILVIGSWKLCCAHCKDLGKSADCTATGFSYPPWPGSANTMRECAAPGGSLYWDASYCTGANYALFPTTTVGWAIQICLTWGGFAVMFVGVLEATQLHRKLQKQWRAIRRGRARTAARA